jgi:Skp family chaperone for outer membrane proteins
MLNTLAIVKKMTAAGMPVLQAEVVAETLVSSLEGELASKRDVEDVRKDLKSELADVRKDLKSEIADLRKDLKSEIADVRKDLTIEIADVRKDLTIEIADVRKELKRDIKDLETTLVHKMEENVSRFEKAMERMQFQMLRAGIGMMLGTVALMTFVSRYIGK